MIRSNSIRDRLVKKVSGSVLTLARAVVLELGVERSNLSSKVGKVSTQSFVIFLKRGVLLAQFQYLSFHAFAHCAIFLARALSNNARSLYTRSMQPPAALNL